MDRVLDVGANTGYFTLLALAANPESKVVAFEPYPPVCASLATNLSINGWSGRCTVLPVAASDHSGTADFQAPATDVVSTTGSLVSERAERFGNIRTISVPVETIDTSCAGMERIGLVKLDIEGEELNALMGMQAILARDKPAIIVECLADANGSWPPIGNFLEQFGYTFYHLAPGGPIPVATIIPDPARRHGNFLCIPAH